MPTFTSTPITVDGLSLDSYAIFVKTKIRSALSVVAGDYRVPGVDGRIATLNDDYEPTLLTLSMLVKGVDPATGVVPSSSIAQVRRNLDELSFTFGKRHGLLDVQETLPELGVRQMMCKVTDAIEPEIKVGSYAEFKVVLEVPDVFSQDTATADWTSTPTLVSGNYYEATTLQGATAPVTDAIVRVLGPITNPRLTDFTTGNWIQLNRVLAGGESWRINAGTWVTHHGTLTLGSADTAGTDAQAITQWGGGTARMLRLVPSLVTAQRRVQLSLTGVGITSATQVQVRARRKFLL